MTTSKTKEQKAQARLNRESTMLKKYGFTVTRSRSREVIGDNQITVNLVIPQDGNGGNTKGERKLSHLPTNAKLSFNWTLAEFEHKES